MYLFQIKTDVHEFFGIDMMKFDSVREVNKAIKLHFNEALTTHIFFNSR